MPRKDTGRWDGLKRNHRAWKACFCPIEEDPHAESLSPLNGYQAHLPADMVQAVKTRDLRFVIVGVALQFGDSPLNGGAKAGTDFKAFMGNAIGNHRRLLGWKLRWPEKFHQPPQVFPTCADSSEEPIYAPYYGLAHLR
jgi:hypothetical protein